MGLFLILFGALCASAAWFFMWRNNKKKFIGYLISIDGFIARNDTQEEIEAKLAKALAELKASLIDKAEEKLDELKN